MKAALVGLTLWPCTCAAQSAFTDEFLTRFAEPLVIGVPFDLDGLVQHRDSHFLDPISDFEVVVRTHNGTVVAVSVDILDLAAGGGDPFPANRSELGTQTGIDAVIESFMRFEGQATGFVEAPECVSTKPEDDATSILFAKALVRPSQNEAEAAVVTIRFVHVLKSYLEPDQGSTFILTLLAATGPDVTCHLPG